MTSLHRTSRRWRSPMERRLGRFLTVSSILFSLLALSNFPKPVLADAHGFVFFRPPPVRSSQRHFQPLFGLVGSHRCRPNLMSRKLTDSVCSLSGPISATRQRTLLTGRVQSFRRGPRCRVESGFRIDGFERGPVDDHNPDGFSDSDQAIFTRSKV